MKIEIDINPMGAVRTTQRAKFTDERFKRYQSYKTALMMFLRGYNIRQCPEVFRIQFVMPFPVSYTQKQCKEKVCKPHQYKPDLDNLVKGFMDCFGKDDSGVHRIEAEKVWGYEGKIILEFE
jgi:Holliday junction resolvase RusA-like endonuclease